MCSYYKISFLLFQQPPHCQGRGLGDAFLLSSGGSGWGKGHRAHRHRSFCVSKCTSKLLSAIKSTPLPRPSWKKPRERSSRLKVIIMERETERIIPITILSSKHHEAEADQESPLSTKRRSLLVTLEDGTTTETQGSVTRISSNNTLLPAGCLKPI